MFALRDPLATGVLLRRGERYAEGRMRSLQARRKDFQQSRQIMDTSDATWSHHEDIAQMITGKVLKARGWPEGKVIGLAKSAAEALEREGQEQEAILARVNRVRPFKLTAMGLAGAMTLFVVVYYILNMISQFRST